MYDLIYGGDDDQALEFVKWLLSFLEIDKSSSILDMGSGTGNLLLPLLGEGYNILGFEPFETMREFSLKKAEKLNYDVTIKEGSFETLDVHEEFDLIMAINGPLHYVEPEDLEMVFSNLSDAVNESGYIVVDTINFFSLIKNYQYPEPLDFDLAGTPATAMIQHWVDLDREKWYNRVVLIYKDQEHHKFEDIQQMSMYTKTQLSLIAEKFDLKFRHFFSSYQDRADKRVYGGRLILVFQKETDEH